jgi:hypothetical protein
MARFGKIQKLNMLSSDLLYRYKKDLLATSLKSPEFVLTLDYFLQRMLVVIQDGGHIDKFFNELRDVFVTKEPTGSQQPAELTIF